MLDHLFEAETIIVKEKKKKDDDESTSDSETEAEVDLEDGYKLTERVGVRQIFEFSKHNRRGGVGETGVYIALLLIIPAY